MTQEEPQVIENQETNGLLVTPEPQETTTVVQASPEVIIVEKDTSRVYETNQEGLEDYLNHLYPKATEILIAPKKHELKPYDLWVEPSVWTWVRRPDAVVIIGNKVIIIEAKSCATGGSVREKLTNPIWGTHYWPKVLKDSVYDFKACIFILTGYKQTKEKGTMELMNAIGLKYYHTEDIKLKPKKLL